MFVLSENFYRRLNSTGKDVGYRSSIYQHFFDASNRRKVSANGSFSRSEKTRQRWKLQSGYTA